MVVAVVVAVIMLGTPVGAPGRASAPDCGTALSGGSEEHAQQADRCVAARSGRMSASLAVLAIGGSLVIPGLMRRSRRNLDERTDQRLAECAGMRSSRVAWALIPAVAGVLVLAGRRGGPNRTTVT